MTRKFTKTTHQRLYLMYLGGHKSMMRQKTRAARAYQRGYSDPRSVPPKLNSLQYFAWQAGRDNRDRHDADQG